MDERLDALIPRARLRDAEALTQLVELLGPRVFGLLFRLIGSRDVAEELTQETFVRMVRMIHRFEPTGSLEGWVFRIAANLARDRGRLRKRRGLPQSLDTLNEDEKRIGTKGVAPQADPSQAMELDERRCSLERALQALPDADREILVLRHFGNLQFREIAELLDMPLGTALARSHRALLKLRERLSEKLSTES